MATTHSERFVKAPHNPAFKAKNMHIDRAEGWGAFGPSNIYAAMFEKNMGAIVGGLYPYTAGDWTITTGGTGDAQAQATTAGRGVLITYASDDNFDTTLDWSSSFTPTSGKKYGMMMRGQMSASGGLGIKIGMTTGGSAAALPFGTNYTDFVGISKPILTTGLVGSVRGNSGTAADTASLITCADATDFEMGFWCYLHATSPAGQFYYNDQVIDFSAAQLTQLAAILTTPPTMFWTIHGTGVTGTNPTLLVKALMTWEDN